MAIQKNDAVAIIEEKLKTHASGDNLLSIVHSDTIDKDDYWVFFYNSSKFLETKDYSSALAGNSPLIIDKYEGKIYETGSANPIEYYMDLFERNELPRIKSRMK